MPIPFLVAAGAAAVAGTAFGIGRASRQGEINELKRTIQELQDKIEILNTIIERQNETIRQLKAENKSLNALRFIEKRKLNNRTRGLIIFEYALREYLEFVNLEAKQIAFDKTEGVLYNILDKMFHGKEVALEEKGLIKVYITNKYPYEVKNLIPLNDHDLSSAIGGRLVG